VTQTGRASMTLMFQLEVGKVLADDTTHDTRHTTHDTRHTTHDTRHLCERS
jgi:hypothetical protein